MHSSNVNDAEKKAQSNLVALFVSDVHLQAAMPRTTQAFLDFLRLHAVKARQLYLLGDMFEYWAGDDDISAPHNKRIVDAIRAVSDSGVAVFWIAGNRDFLAGADFAEAAGASMLPDPSVVTLCDQRIVLTHGDAQCTDDLGYMAFRAQVRRKEWQEEFLARPLAQRKTIIEGLRQGSREAQRNKSYEIMDTNPAAIAALFDSSGAAVMIHGHTHRPRMHEYPSATGEKRRRYVLTDWDCDDEQARGGWLAIDADGAFRQFGVDGVEC